MLHGFFQSISSSSLTSKRTKSVHFLYIRAANKSTAAAKGDLNNRRKTTAVLGLEEKFLQSNLDFQPCQYLQKEETEKSLKHNDCLHNFVLKSGALIHRCGPYYERTDKI